MMIELDLHLPWKLVTWRKLGLQEVEEETEDWCCGSEQRA